MSNARRISMDLKDVAKCNVEPGLGISVVLNGGMSGFDAFLKGPVDTPYHGGIFKVEITIPPEYPIKPPVAFFKTKIWHPNVSSVTGFTCIDILADKWLGVMGFRSVLLSLQNLLANPEPNDAQDISVGGQMLRDKAVFETTAQMWTHIYAGGKDYHPSNMLKLRKLIEMGYTEACALSQLSLNDWVLEEALECLAL